MIYRSVTILTALCIFLSCAHTELWTATKTLFPSEYKERHQQVRKKKNRHRGSLPGSISRRSRLNRRANGGGQNVLTMWAGVCFVLLFMMLGFTVFATTVGFVAWYLLEVAMELLVDLTLELQTFSEVLKTSCILFCIDGGLSAEKRKTLWDSASRVAGAFTKLMRSRSLSNFTATDALYPTGENAGSSSAQGGSSGGANDMTYEALWKVTQTYIANYVVLGCLVTFLLYRLAKYMQTRRA